MNIPRARIWVVIAAAVVVVAAIASIALYANRFQYDEDAHQNVIEAYGMDITDWDAYSNAIRSACKFDEDRFREYLLAGDDLNRLQLDIQYACPDRMDEFSDITGMPPLD
jgi:hypothetical protein